MNGENERPVGSWWQTVPGILTAVGTVMTALTGLVVAFHQAGLFGSNAKEETPASRVETTTNSSDWLTTVQYQQEFNKRVQDGFYPRQVEGRCHNNNDEFRAEWKSIPLGASFFSNHGITKEEYDSKSPEHTANGYFLVSLTNFKDCSNVDRYQATWLKR